MFPEQGFEDPLFLWAVINQDSAAFPRQDLDSNQYLEKWSQLLAAGFNISLIWCFILFLCLAVIGWDKIWEEWNKIQFFVALPQNEQVCFAPWDEPQSNCSVLPLSPIPKFLNSSERSNTALLWPGKQDMSNRFLRINFSKVHYLSHYSSAQLNCQIWAVLWYLG